MNPDEEDPKPAPEEPAPATGEGGSPQLQNAADEAPAQPAVPSPAKAQPIA